MESQEQKLLRFAEQEGFEVAAVFKDNGAVGHGFDREGYKLLREAVKCGEVNAVLVNNLDRISRDYVQLASQLEWFRSAASQLSPQICLRVALCPHHSLRCTARSQRCRKSQDLYKNYFL